MFSRLFLGFMILMMGWWIELVDIRDAVIMGNIYDPDTDCQFVLMRVSAVNWDCYLKDLEEENDK